MSDNSLGLTTHSGKPRNSSLFSWLLFAMNLDAVRAGSVYWGVRSSWSQVVCHIVQFVCSICLESAAYGLPVIVNAQMRGKFYETFMKRRAARVKIHRQR
jgi:hypothetical protein